MLDFIREFDQEPTFSNRRSLAEKRLKGIEEPPELYAVLDFFDTVGLLTKRGYLNAVDVWDSFSNWIFPIYADSREIIDQGHQDDPNFYTNLVLLVNQLKVIESEHDGTWDRPSKEDIAYFWQKESEIKVGANVKTRRRRARE